MTGVSVHFERKEQYYSRSLLKVQLITRWIQETHSQCKQSTSNSKQHGRSVDQPSHQQQPSCLIVLGHHTSGCCSCIHFRQLNKTISYNFKDKKILTSSEGFVVSSIDLRALEEINADSARASHLELNLEIQVHEVSLVQLNSANSGLDVVCAVGNDGIGVRSLRSNL